MSAAGKQDRSTRDTKRARFAGQGEKSGGASPWVLIAGLAVVVAIVGGAVFALTRPAAARPVEGVEAEGVSSWSSDSTAAQAIFAPPATSGHAPYPRVQAEDGAVRLPLSTFDDEKAHYYTYVHEGEPIEFFVLKSKDGVVRAAFNACDVCFAAKKGYSQEGEYMVCNNCGQRFPADKINEVRGGCNPSPLDRSVEDDSLIILVEDIVQGQTYF